MDNNIPLTTADDDGDYPVYTMVNRRNFLSAATLASTGAGMVTAGSAQAADMPAAASASLGGARGVTSAITEQDKVYMREAIRVMRQVGVVDRSGFPFGAVIVKDGKVIATAGNSVWKDKDPTAHAEVNAIRQACKRVGSNNIPGAILYTSCECCPMCYAAAYWARIDKIFYAAGLKDSGDVFSGPTIEDDMSRPNPQRILAPQQMLRDEGKAVWDEFRKLPPQRR